MGKYFVWMLGLLLAFAPQSRADVTVSDGSADSFQTAVDDTVTAGGGTILVTAPILIGGTNDNTDDTFDGESTVVVSGGGTTSIFIIQNGTELALANFTLENGLSTNGGAIYVSEESTLTVTNCIFTNNIARGADGESVGTNTDATTLSSKKTAVTNINLTAQSAFGGAIYNLGDASFFNCQFLTNTVIGGNGGDAGPGTGNAGNGGGGGGAIGGGIFNGGTLEVVNSTFDGNSATGGDGGLGNTSRSQGNGGLGGYAAGAGLYSSNMETNVTILNCTFSDNVAAGGISGDGGISPAGIGRAGRNGSSALGGGIDNAGWMALTNCTFFKNNAIGGTGGNGGNGGGKGGGGGSGGGATGGGLYNTGTVVVVNCTFSKGGAIPGTNGAGGSGINSGPTGDRGRRLGGNIANVAKKKKGSFTLINSIVTTSLSGDGSYGTIVDGGFNISSDRSIKFSKKSTSKMNLNPLVGDLADNGGPTETMALATNSPAVDRLNRAIAPNTDQRGLPRPLVVFTNLSDIGAYELDKDTAKILTSPLSTNVIQGSNVTFTVTAGGTGPLFYQWLFNGAPVIGSTNTSLTITNVQATNKGNFQAVVTNAFNAATSQVAVLTVTVISNIPPGIASGPTNQTVLVGATTAMSVTVTGTPPVFTYQWYFQNFQNGTTTNLSNGGNISGATSNVLTIVNAQTTNSGNYFVTVTNIAGHVTSSLATLVVQTNSTPAAILSGNTVVAPPQQPSLVPLASQNAGAGGMMNFAFASQPGTTYVIEHKKSLSDSTWTPISTNIGTGDWLTNQMPVTGEPNGFYRVRSP